MSRSLDSLPGPSGLPLIGNLAALGGDPLGFMTEVSHRYGTVATFRVGRTPTLLLTEPALVEEVLLQHRHATVKDPVTASLRDLLGEGLLTSEGETWKRSRRLVAPSFQPRHLAALGGTMVESTERRLEVLGEGETDVHPEMMALTLDIAVRTLFGTVMEDTARVGPLVEELMQGFDRRVHSWQRLLPEWVPTDARRTAQRNKTELHRILTDLVQRRRATLADGGGEGADLLARLLAARDDEGRGLDDAQLRDELLTLFLAGHETTALGLGFALWLLAEHPEVQQQVRAELAEVLGDRRPNAADTRRLPVLDAVFDETMRLYPPAWIIGRQATEDLVLHDAVEGDVSVPAGTPILMPQWVVHRDPRWWSEPAAFQPQRWLSEHDRHRFSFYPFGGGPRVCVGNHFARMEALLVLATLLQELDLHAVAPAPELMASVTLRPRHGIRVGLRRRRGDRAAA